MQYLYEKIPKTTENFSRRLGMFELDETSADLVKMFISGWSRRTVDDYVVAEKLWPIIFEAVVIWETGLNRR